MKCVYCWKNDVDFNREHVLPQFLWYFNSKNFVLDWFVCSFCNNNFSKIEGIFKQDSMEGILAQQLNVAQNSSIWVTNKRLKINSEPGFDNFLHQDMFPFLKIENGKIVIDLNKTQIRMRDTQSGYRVFQVEELKRIASEWGKDFNKLKERIGKLKKEDMAIFLPADWLEDGQLDKVISILKQYNINYVPWDTKFADNEPKSRWMIGFQCTLDRDLCRVLAKIIFNYFTYCLMKKWMSNVAYRNEFKKIRNFISGDETVWVKEILFHHSDMPYLQADQPHPHLLDFQVFKNKVIGQVSLFGKKSYMIMLGDLPSDITDSEDISSFHIFDPFTHTIE